VPVVALSLVALALSLLAVVIALDARAVARRALDTAARAATDLPSFRSDIDTALVASAHAEKEAKRATDALALGGGERRTMKTFLRPSKQSKR
jgi:hypothetical protein